jgi:hypothetical protein
VGSMGVSQQQQVHGASRQAAANFKMHVCVLSVLAVGTAAIATFGFKGAKDAKLPITVGPQTSGRTYSNTSVFLGGG